VSIGITFRQENGRQELHRSRCRNSRRLKPLNLHVSAKSVRDPVILIDPGRECNNSEKNCDLPRTEASPAGRLFVAVDATPLRV
jgi:hypothetical protein